MGRASESSISGCWPHLRAAGWTCAFVLAATMLNGCKSAPETKVTTSDPLMGERPPEQPFGVAGPTPPPQNRAGMGAPGPPTATASKSVAGCLVPDPLIGAKPIAIADSTQPQPTPANTTGGWQAKDTQTSTPATSPSPGGVILRNPEPVPVTPIQPVPPPSVAPTQGAAIQPVPPPPTPVPAAGIGSVPPPPTPAPSTGMIPQTEKPAIVPASYSEPDPLQSALKARGVLSHDQKTVPEGVQVTCRVANPQDPNSIRVYEATGSDYRSAVQAVLNQIDQQR
jgi:hypothetical protein